MIWWIWLGAGLPGLGLAVGVYRFGSINWASLGLGVFLALLLGGFELIRMRLAPRAGPRLLWGSLAGGAAWVYLSALLEPLSGLTWMLTAPFHQAAMLLICMVLGALLLPASWPPDKPVWQKPGLGLMLLLALGGLVVLAGLAMGVKALTLDSGSVTAGGLKGLIKNPSLLLLGFGLAGAGLCGAARLRPAWVVFRLVPVAAFGLIWAGLGLDLVSSMHPVIEAVSREVLQLIFLLAALSLGLRLSSAALPKESNPPTRQ